MNIYLDSKQILVLNKSKKNLGKGKKLFWFRWLGRNLKNCISIFKERKRG